MKISVWLDIGRAHCLQFSLRCFFISWKTYYAGISAGISASINELESLLTPKLQRQQIELNALK